MKKCFWSSLQTVKLLITVLLFYCHWSNSCSVPVNILDLIQNCYGDGSYGQCAARIRLDHIICMPDPTSHFQFSSVFSKESPDLIRMAWSGFWQNTSGLEVGQCARFIRPGSGRTQLAHNQFSTFRRGCSRTKMAWIILCKTSPDPV